MIVEVQQSVTMVTIEMTLDEAADPKAEFKIKAELYRTLCDYAKNQPGGHIFVGKKCRCGQTTSDDPKACTHWIYHSFDQVRTFS